MKTSTWKIIKSLTLLIPLPIYLLLNAVLFSVTPDVKINADIDVLSVVEYEDEYFIYGDAETTFSNGYVILNDGIMGAVIDSEDIIQIGLEYYSYVEKDDVMQLVPLKLLEEQQGYKIPISIFISLLGVGIVILFVMGKMDIMKQHPKTATLVGLWVLALVFIVIDTIVKNLTGVFVVAAITWTIYYLEDMAQNGLITKADADKKTSKLLEELKSKL